MAGARYDAGLSKQSYFFCTHNFCIDLSSSSTGLCRPALKVVGAKIHVMFEICFKQYYGTIRLLERSPNIKHSDPCFNKISAGNVVWIPYT